jgi:hypothetical protein
MLYETWIYTNLDSMGGVYRGLTKGEPDLGREALDPERGWKCAWGAAEQERGCFQELAEKSVLGKHLFEHVF